MTVAGYMASDIIATKFWNDEWINSDETDPDVVTIHDLSVALELPGDTVVDPNNPETTINRKQAWKQIEETLGKLEEKYL